MLKKGRLGEDFSGRRFRKIKNEIIEILDVSMVVENPSINYELG